MCIQRKSIPMTKWPKYLDVYTRAAIIRIYSQSIITLPRPIHHGPSNPHNRVAIASDVGLMNFLSFVVEMIKWSLWKGALSTFACLVRRWQVASTLLMRSSIIYINRRPLGWQFGATGANARVLHVYAINEKFRINTSYSFSYRPIDH